MAGRHTVPVRRSPEAVREEVRRACRTGPDPLAVQRTVAAALPAAVPFDRWCGLLLDPATLLTTTGYHEEGLPEHVCPGCWRSRRPTRTSTACPPWYAAGRA